MEPVDPTFSRVFRLAELEDLSVDVTAEIEDAFKLPMVATDWRASSVRSFAVIHVVGVWTLTVQNFEGGEVPDSAVERVHDSLAHCCGRGHEFPT